jgi:hypothetical protein
MYSYRFLLIYLFTASMLAFGFFISGCKDEQSTDAIPVIRFLPVNGVIVSDTALPLGGSLVISLEAIGGGSNITYFGVTMNDGQMHYVLDSGMNNATLKYSQPIFKGNSPNEHWTFTVMNRDRQKSSISMNITKAIVSEWGKIITYDLVILGAQGNPADGGFFSLQTGLVSTYQQAEANPSNTDIIYYFGDYEGTFSSPLESEAPSYFPGLNTWSIKNETRYDTTSLSSVAFVGAKNDSLLLVSYEPVNGKRKAKFLQPGMVVAFRNHSGKTGLVFIKNLVAGATGKLECAIKVQQ